MNTNMKFSITGQRIELTEPVLLVAGTMNIYTASFVFDSDWDGYTKTAVFRGGDVEREQLLTDDACTVPWEVLLPGAYLKVGVYGTRDGIRLPTIWTERTQYINSGAGPTEEAAEPSPTLVEQLLTKVGNLDALKTEDKTSVVAAINEVWASGGGGSGGGTTDHSKLKNRDAAGQHPMSAITGLEAALKGKQPAGSYLTDKDLDTTLKEVGKAADAKATGDALRSLSEDIEKLEQSDAMVALAETAKKVKAYQKPDSLTIALMSDTHYTSSDHNAAEKLATARLMAKASGLYHVDIVGNLGDLIPGKETLDVAKSDLTAIVGATASNNANRIAVARGNHDDNGWYSQGGYGGSYQPDEMLDALGQYQYVDSMDNGLVRDTNKPDGGYGYYDHDASKIRVFLLNTSDIPYVLKEDGSYRYTSYGYAAFSNEQINFVANALKFEDKDVPNDWAALFMMHIPMDTTNEDGYRFGIRDALIRGVTQMLGVITAYKNGSRYQFSGSVYNVSNANEVQEDFMVSVNVDYSKKGEGDVIGFISGHTHADNYSNAVGVERSPSRGYSFLSLMGSVSFANFIVNRSDNSISFVKHGKASPDLTEGASVVAPALGSIEGGEWTIYFDQFRPEVVNLFAGWDSAGAGHYINPDNVMINLETMELTEHVEDARYICSKAVPITPLATYKIPADFNGGVIAFNAGGAKSGFITPVAYDGYKTVTSTLSTQYYMVFYAHMSTYTDYENMTVELML